LFGIGGGIIFLPALFFVLPLIGVESNLITVSAIATSLFAGSFASTSSFYNHWKNNNVSLNEGIILGLGCLISASIVPKFIINLDPTLLRYFIALFITLISLNLFSSKEREHKNYKDFDKKYLFIFGLSFGGIAALSGFGGGIFYVPLMLYYFKGDLKLAVGTSTIAVVLTMISSVASFLFLNTNWNADTIQFGYINLQVGLLLGVGSLLGSKVGVKIISNISIPVFKKIFSLFLLLSIIKILQG